MGIAFREGAKGEDVELLDKAPQVCCGAGYRSIFLKTDGFYAITSAAILSVTKASITSPTLMSP
jgi:hypothetical protein